MTDIYKLLKKDHSELKPMLKELSGGKEDRLDTMATEFRAHARAEEAVFYKPLGKNAETKDLIKEATREHKAADKLVDQLMKERGHELRFRAAAKLLQEAIEHHIKEEEGEVFKKAKTIFSSDQAETMGSEFERQKQSIMVGA